MKNRKAFTLIEMLVAVGILALVLVAVGGTMTMSFKAKRNTEAKELISSRAVFSLNELKKNVLDAVASSINCPIDVGNSISFTTKNGSSTTLLCDSATGQIASKSASEKVNFLGGSVTALDCNDFVWCNTADGMVLSIGFSLSLQTTSNGSGTTANFQTIVSPRE